MPAEAQGGFLFGHTGALRNGDTQLPIRDSESEIRRWVCNRGKKLGSCIPSGVVGVMSVEVSLGLSA